MSRPQYIVEHQCASHNYWPRIVVATQTLQPVCRSELTKIKTTQTCPSGRRAEVCATPRRDVQACTMSISVEGTAKRSRLEQVVDSRERSRKAPCQSSRDIFSYAQTSGRRDTRAAVAVHRARANFIACSRKSYPSAEFQTAGCVRIKRDASISAR